MASIFNITEDYSTLLKLTDELLEVCEKEEREPTEDEQKTLCEFLLENESQFSNKVDCYRKKINDTNVTIKAISEEIARLQKRKKAREKLIENLKGFLTYAMKVRKLEKLETDTFTVSFKKNPPSVVIDNESLIPENFFRIKKEVDKASIKDVLKAGQSVLGAHLETDIKSIWIR